jgi:hypothetical protein
MKRLGRLAISCLLLATASACKADRSALSDDGPERSCVSPRLTVVGHQHQPGPLPVRPGQTLHVRGIHYTDDCHVADTGESRTIPSVQLVLQSVHHVGPVATVHPRGPHASFTAVVTIPPSTAFGPAKIFDNAGSSGGGIRLVVRR